MAERNINLDQYSMLGHIWDTLVPEHHPYGFKESVIHGTFSGNVHFQSIQMATNSTYTVEQLTTGVDAVISVRNTTQCKVYQGNFDTPLSISLLAPLPDNGFHVGHVRVASLEDEVKVWIKNESTTDTTTVDVLILEIA